MAAKKKAAKKGAKPAKTKVQITGYILPDGNNERSKVIDKSLNDHCKLQAEEDALIALHIKPIREKKNKIKAKLKEDFGIPTDAFNARASLRRIELTKGNEDTKAAVNELFAVVPVNKGVDMEDLIDVIKKRQDEEKKAAEKGKATEAEA